jgi:hypothetical protein
MKRILHILILIILLAAFSTCKKDKISVNPEFKWFTDGKVFHYDYYTATGIQRDYLSIAVAGDMLLPNIDPAKAPQVSLENIYGHYVVKIDGLYATAPTECSLESFFTVTFSYLYAPDNPVTNQQIPVYLCQKQIDYNMVILATNQSVVVPQGTFNTYIIQYQNNDKGYWDPGNGLIMYETHDQNGQVTGLLKLDGVTTQ